MNKPSVIEFIDNLVIIKNKLNDDNIDTDSIDEILTDLIKWYASPSNDPPITYIMLLNNTNRTIFVSDDEIITNTEYSNNDIRTESLEKKIYELRKMMSK